MEDQTNPTAVDEYKLPTIQRLSQALGQPLTDAQKQLLRRPLACDRRTAITPIINAYMALPELPGPANPNWGLALGRGVVSDNILLSLVLDSMSVDSLLQLTTTSHVDPVRIRRLYQSIQLLFPPFNPCQ